MSPSFRATDDKFGGSVAINQGRIAVGAPFIHYRSFGSNGKVFVFAREGGPDWQQIALRVVRHLFENVGIDDMGLQSVDQQCVPIGRSPHHRLGSDHAVGPAAVIDQDLLRPDVGQLPRDEPAQHVDIAPRCPRHHDTHRFLRVVFVRLRLRATAQQHRSRQIFQSFHASPFFWNIRS